jgi:hypothetical protein
MLKTKLVLVVGAPGARMDFVAGWLSLLPNFVNMNWGLDPITHQSYGDMRFAKMLDYGESFDDIWPGQFQLSADTNLYITGTGHGGNLNKLQDKMAAGLVKTVIINTSSPTVNVKKIKWEFVIKTYLSQNKVSYHQAYRKNVWLIDGLIDKLPKDITNNDRISKVDELLKNSIGDAFISQIHCPEAINIDYNLLFQSNGSQYLCDQLAVAADAPYHQHWNAMLPLAESPSELNVWGHLWRYKDYFTD